MTNRTNVRTPQNQLPLFSNSTGPASHGGGRGDFSTRVESLPAAPPLVSAITGVRPYPVFRIDMVKDREFYGPSITTPDDLGRLFASYLGLCPVEHFAVCLLTTQLRPSGLVTVSIGTIDMAPVWMPSVFRPAIIQGSPVIAIGHCHPSTSLSPSKADKAITRRIVEAGKLLDIRVIDHVIVGGPSSWASFAEMGLM